MKRVFLFVLDSCGIGAAPDAAAFGDEGANTLRRISDSECFSSVNMNALGLCEIDGVTYLGENKNHTAAVARLSECSAGKDTTVGHWEIAGLISQNPLPTYENGFPEELLKEFSRRVGRGVLCNKPYSGTEVLKDFGEQHIKSGDLIVYTSADSVFQIAAHEEVVPLGELYSICRTARELLTGEHAVGRVIARPFIGEKDSFTRTANRHDFSLPPQGRTLLSDISDAGLEVFAVGKINDIFAGVGITEKVHTVSNTDGMEKALLSLSRGKEGLTFINLVDFDMVYGHREDISGYAAAFSQFDEFLPRFISKMQEDDLLIITADHGCDPGDGNTDHTREYVPLLIYGNKISPINLGTIKGFSSIAATVAEYLSVPYSGAGESLLQKIYKG